MVLLNSNKKQLGSSLIEAIIAMAIFMIIITSLVTLYFLSQETSYNSATRYEALLKAQTSLEAVRSIRNIDWFDLIIGTHGLEFQSNKWVLLKDSPDTEDGFTRSVEISYIDDDTKKIDITITYPSLTGVKEVSIVQYLTRWMDISAQDIAWGDWSIPYTVGTGDIGEGNFGTDISVSKKYAFITSVAENDTAPDLFVFDTSDPTNPLLINQLNIEQGLESVFVKTGYAYVVEQNSDDFFVIDVGDPSAPFVVAKLDLNDTGKGRSVFAQGQYAYIGDDKKFMHVVDISNPSLPVQIAKYERVSNDLRDISILDDTAYVAQDGSNKPLHLIDISIPSDPTKISEFQANGGSATGTAVQAKTHDRVYIGRDIGANPNHAEFIVVDASDELNPHEIGSFDIGDGGIDDLHIIAQEYALLVTSVPSEEFQVLDIQNLNNISIIATLDFPAPATGIAYYKNYAFVSVADRNALQIVTAP
jgi:hypothetical protein